MRTMRIVGWTALLAAGFVFYGIFLQHPGISPVVLYASCVMGLGAVALLFAAELQRPCPLKGHAFYSDPCLAYVRPKKLDKKGRICRLEGTCQMCGKSWTFKPDRYPPVHP